MPRAAQRDDVIRMMEAGATVVEVLPGQDYRRLHLAGAIHIPLAKLDRRRAERLDRTRPVIVYCYDTQ